MLHDSNQSANYISRVQNKTAEEILADPECGYHGPIGEYLRIAAEVRTNQELAACLMKASADSGKLQIRLMVLTFVVALAGVCGVIATAWPYLVWWSRNGFRLS